MYMLKEQVVLHIKQVYTVSVLKFFNCYQDSVKLSKKRISHVLIYTTSFILINGVHECHRDVVY